MKPIQKDGIRIVFCIVWLFQIVTGPAGFADEIITKKVDWKGPSGARIKEVRYRIPKPLAAEKEAMVTKSMPVSESAYVIDSPPLDGFVPWIVITTTNKRDSEDVWTASVEPAVTGSFTAANPASEFAIGVFDTGASAHVFGYEMSNYLGLQNFTYLTSNYTVVSGVTGEVDAVVSQPIGVFIGGLQNLDNSGPEPLLNDTSALRGEGNVSVIVGDYPGEYPDLVTAIGTPLSVFYTTFIDNSRPITVTYQGTEYTGPRVTLHEHEDPNIPTYSIQIPLELRPLGSVSVEYVPTIDIGSLEYEPSSPSVIIGTGSQSMFFVHSVDLHEGQYIAIDKDRFMLDTGAQISVIGSRTAARLGLNPQAWEFQVEIIGVTGESIDAPGFYLDSVQIPALGQWLEYTNVPVVLLDISSPEGGTLDGIIGMNLFTEYNLVLRGGGMFTEDDPVLEVRRVVPLVGDIAPQPRDGRVDLLDFDAFSAAWLSTSGQTNWNPDADLAPSGQIDLADLVILAGQWLSRAD